MAVLGAIWVQFIFLTTRLSKTSATPVCIDGIDNKELSSPRWLLAYWLAMGGVEKLSEKLEETNLECIFMA